MSTQSLIHGYVLSGPHKGQAITPERVLAHDFPEGTIWLHFDYTLPETRQWLREFGRLDEIDMESILSGETRPRSHVTEECLIATWRGLNLNPGSDPEDMVTIRIWAVEDFIITTRKRRIFSVEEMRQQIEAGTGPETTGEVLTQLAERLIKRMQAIITEIEESVSEVEEEAHLEGAQKHRARIADLRRQATALRRYLKPQLEAFNVLQDPSIVLFDDDDRARLHETSNHLTRYIEELEAIRDRAAITQEELAANVAEELNNRMYVLSIVAAIFLPLGFLTGLLGVNVAGIPGAEYDLAFLLFCLLLGGLTAAQIVLFRIKRWF